MQTLEADILARESRLRKLTIARDPALQMRAMSDRAVFDDPAVRARMLEIQQSTTHLREMLESSMRTFYLYTTCRKGTPTP